MRAIDKRAPKVRSKRPLQIDVTLRREGDVFVARAKFLAPVLPDARAEGDYPSRALHNIADAIESRLFEEDDYQ